MGIDESLLTVDYRSIGPDADVMPEEMDLEFVESEASAELGETLDERAERLLSRVIPPRDAAAETEALEQARRALEQDPQWALVRAVAEGDLRRVEELLEAGADVNGPSPAMQLTPLATAVSSARLDMVRKLIDLGADVRRPGMAGMPLMFFAVASRSRANVQAMLEAGVEVDAPDLLGRTPLHHAVELLVDPEIIETLIRAGADVNAVTKSGDTPLSLVGRSRHDLAHGPGLLDLEDEPAARQLHGQLAEIERLLRKAGGRRP